MGSRVLQRTSKIRKTENGKQKKENGKRKKEKGNRKKEKSSPGAYEGNVAVLTPYSVFRSGESD